VLVVDARSGERPGRGAATDRKRLTAELAFRKVLAQPLDPELLVRAYEVRGDSLSLPARTGEIEIPLDLGVRARICPDTASFGDAELQEAARRLGACVVADNGRLCVVFAGAASDGNRSATEARRALSEALAALRRLAHAKHASAFASASSALAEAAARRGGAPGARTLDGIVELERLLELRSRSAGRRASGHSLPSMDGAPSDRGFRRRRFRRDSPGSPSP
jgi:hypothetical protein